MKIKYNKIIITIMIISIFPNMGLSFDYYPIIQTTDIDSSNVSINTTRYYAVLSKNKAILWNLTTSQSDYRDEFIGCTNNTAFNYGGALIPIVPTDGYSSYCLEDITNNIASLYEVHPNNICVEVNRTTNFLRYNCSYYTSSGTLIYQTLLEFFPDHIDLVFTYASTLAGASRPLLSWSFHPDQFCKYNDPDSFSYNSSDSKSKMFDPSGYDIDMMVIQTPHVSFTDGSCSYSVSATHRSCICDTNGGGDISGRYSIRFYNGTASNDKATFVDKKFDNFIIDGGENIYNGFRNYIYEYYDLMPATNNIYDYSSEVQKKYDTFILNKPYSEIYGLFYKPSTPNSLRYLFPFNQDDKYQYLNSPYINNVNSSHYSIYNDTHIVFTYEEDFSTVYDYRFTQGQIIYVNETIYDIWFNQTWKGREVINLTFDDESLYGENIELYYNLSDEYCDDDITLYLSTKSYYLIDDSENIIDYYCDVYSGTVSDCYIRFNGTHIYNNTTFYLYVNNTTSVQNRNNYPSSPYGDPLTATRNLTSGGYEELINRTYFFQTSEDIFGSVSFPYYVWSIPKCNGTYLWSNCVDNETIIDGNVNVTLDYINYQLDFIDDMYIATFLESEPVIRSYNITFYKDNYETLLSNNFIINITAGCGYQGTPLEILLCSVHGVEGFYENTTNSFSTIIISSGFVVMLYMLFLFIKEIYE